MSSAEEFGQQNLCLFKLLQFISIWIEVISHVEAVVRDEESTGMYIQCFPYRGVTFKFLFPTDCLKNIFYFGQLEV